MAQTKHLICASGEVIDGAAGYRFTVNCDELEKPAFVIRYRGQVYGYINHCAHIGVELDWSPGQFFDVSGIYLLCSTHGALYAPETGRCIGGPCAGKALQAIDVVEDGGAIYLLGDI